MRLAAGKGAVKTGIVEPLSAHNPRLRKATGISIQPRSTRQLGPTSQDNFPRPWSPSSASEFTESQMWSLKSKVHPTRFQSCWRLEAEGMVPLFSYIWERLPFACSTIVPKTHVIYFQFYRATAGRSLA